MVRIWACIIFLLNSAALVPSKIDQLSILTWKYGFKLEHRWVRNTIEVISLWPEWGRPGMGCSSCSLCQMENHDLTTTSFVLNKCASTKKSTPVRFEEWVLVAKTTGEEWQSKERVSLRAARWLKFNYFPKFFTTL